jgi:hypothetical protein
MVKWYKHDELDKVMPGKKADLLNRHYKTCNHGECTVTVLPAAPMLREPSLIKTLPPLENVNGDKGSSDLEPFPLLDINENEVG